MKVKLTNVRAAFCNVFKPTSGQDGEGEPKYNLAVLFPPGHPAEKIMNDAIEAVAKEKWPKDYAKNLVNLRKLDKVALHDGDTKEYDGYAGHLFVNSNNATRPTVRDRDGRTPLTQDDGRPYSGCYVDVILDVWAQDNKFGKRVNASLAGVQFRAHGDAFSGGNPATDDDFESIDEGADDFV